MKIISPFKDYYDYLQNVYGIDDKVVFIRNKNSYVFPLKYIYAPTNYRKVNNLETLKLEYDCVFICDEVYYMIKHNNQFVTDKQEIVNILNEFKFNFYYLSIKIGKIRVEDLDRIFLNENIKNMNTNQNQPIITTLDSLFLQRDYNWITNFYDTRTNLRHCSQ